MEKKKRSFAKIKNTMNLKDFESFCRRIATQYAKSNGEFSGSYFMRTENISRDCFYKVLDEAVVRNLISDELVDKMEMKAIANQRNHAKNAGETSKQHYAILRKKRNEYIICLYSDAEINELAKDFAESIEESKKDFAKRYEISISVLAILYPQDL